MKKFILAVFILSSFVSFSQAWKDDPEIMEQLEQAEKRAEVQRRINDKRDKLIEQEFDKQLTKENTKLNAVDVFERQQERHRRNPLINNQKLQGTTYSKEAWDAYTEVEPGIYKAKYDEYYPGMGKEYNEEMQEKKDREFWLEILKYVGYTVLTVIALFLFYIEVTKYNRRRLF